MSRYTITASIVLSLLIVSTESQGPSTTTRDDRKQLHLLNILPFPDGRPDSGWDRALELMPAAQLAADQINNASDLLPGYKINLTVIDSEACGHTTIVKGLVNTYKAVLDSRKPYNVVGLTGLFCSSVTNVVAPLFSYPNITYLQLAGSTTPAHRDIDRYPWLVHLISSSTTFTDALFALMNEFNWKNLAMIHDSLGIFFTSVALEVKEFTLNSPDFNLTLAIPVTSGTIDTNMVFENLVQSRSRIVFVSGTVPECVLIMCEAYNRNALYPGYVYIFHDRSTFDFINNANITNCTPQQLRVAINGVIFMQYELASEDEETLVSNVTYKEYHDEYIRRLEMVESSMNVKLDKNNVYANAMYDEVWSFALALNDSLGEISDQNITLDDLSLDQNEALATILTKHVLQLSFQGASGFVKFGANREESSGVRYYQVIDNEERAIAVYNPDAATNDTIKVLEDAIQLPSDTFDQRIHLLPLWLTVLFTVISSMCVIFTTVVLIFVIVLRKRTEIKASSLKLSYIIFAGCYIMFIAAQMRTMSRGYPISSDTIFTLVCNIEVWFANLGINIIFSTLLMRLMRIHHIFKAYGKVGKYWRDEYILLWIAMICSGGLLLYVVWTAYDLIRKVTTIEYRYEANLPFFESTSICSCDYLSIWLIVGFSYSGAIIAVVMFLAIQTRKIKLAAYKDTKKINAFIFAVVASLATLMPLWFLTEKAIRSEIAGHITISLAFLSVGFLCQLFIFLPQVYITLRNIRTEKFAKEHGLPMKRRKTQFSQL